MPARTASRSNSRQQLPVVRCIERGKPVLERLPPQQLRRHAGGKRSNARCRMHATATWRRERARARSARDWALRVIGQHRHPTAPAFVEAIQARPAARGSAHRAAALRWRPFRNRSDAAAARRRAPPPGRSARGATRPRVETKFSSTPAPGTAHRVAPPSPHERTAVLFAVSGSGRAPSIGGAAAGDGARPLQQLTLTAAGPAFARAGRRLQLRVRSEGGRKSVASAATVATRPPFHVLAVHQADRT
jgi:hypothetical protein